MSHSISSAGYKCTRSEFAKSMLRIDGKPVNLDDYPMFLDVYDGGHRKTLLMTSRQVGKSTTLSNFSIGESVTMPFFKTLFIAPTQEQTHKFSTSRVGKTILYSPIVRKYFMDPSTPNRVLARTFTNGSEIVFSYAEDDADRCRGNSADRLCMDEVQDILLDAVLPVVKETLSNSEHQFETYCGTPKTFENSIAHMWKTSTRTEWAMKCPGCSKYSIIVSEIQLGPAGPICRACNALLNPRTGLWVDMNLDKDVEVKGFHISRPMMPKSVPAAWPIGPERDKAAANWKEVWSKLAGSNPYPLSMFRNEVLGVSDSQGRRIVTLEDLEDQRTGPRISVVPTAENMKDVTALAAGIDWSGGGTSIKSRTVVAIIGRTTASKYRLMNFKIFPGTNPWEEIAQIHQLLANYDRGSQLFVGADAGEGNMNMDSLRNRMPNPARLLKIRYVGSQNSYVKWNQEGHFYTVNRTVAIDSIMSSFKAGGWEFPKEPKEIMALPFSDILNEYEEVTREGRKRWDHAPTNPDDFLHALNFARIALQLRSGELNLGSAM